MPFSVYILYSKKRGRYYVGQTKNLEARLIRHNSSKVPSTRTGVPWTVIWSAQKPTRRNALELEKQIKGRGAKRFLEDIEK